MFGNHWGLFCVVVIRCSLIGHLAAAGPGLSSRIQLRVCGLRHATTVILRWNRYVGETSGRRPAIDMNTKEPRCPVLDDLETRGAATIAGRTVDPGHPFARPPPPTTRSSCAAALDSRAKWTGTSPFVCLMREQSAIGEPLTHRTHSEPTNSGPITTNAPHQRRTPRRDTPGRW